MRILYVTNNFPYPLTSGYLRHYYLIRELSASHKITLASLVGPTFTDDHAKALAPYTDQILTFRSRGRGARPGHKLLRQARSGLRQDHAVAQMREAIAQVMQTSGFDGVVLSGKGTLAALGRLEGVPIIADMCDATSMRIRRRMRYARVSRLPLLVLKYARMRQIERAVMNRASHLLFISARDRKDVLGSMNHPSTIIPNGVDVDYWKRTLRQRGRHTLVFTGAMHYQPNADAALLLIERIFPRVQETVPDAELFIVGRDPTPRLVAAGQVPGVTVTGWVEDVRPYLDRATLFVAPLRFGAGMQNKLLEAMAMEVPVVASPLAAEGLRTEAGDEPPIVLATTPEQFAAAISEKLQEAAHTLEPDAAARDYVKTHFVWRRSGARLDQVINCVTLLRENEQTSRTHVVPCRAK